MKNRTAAMMIVAATATAALSGAKTGHAGYRLDIEYTTSVQGSAWLQSDASHYEDLSNQVWWEANQTCSLQQGRGWRWTSWRVEHPHSSAHTLPLAS